MKTSRFFVILATLLCSTGLTACGDGISTTFSTFKDLCEASGGTVVDENKSVCKCDKECTTGVVCIAGKCGDSVEKKCDVNKEAYCENGNLYSCNNDGILEKTPCPSNECLNEKECRECAEGDTKCEDDGMKTCINGKWGESDKSCNGFGCRLNGTECAKCRANDMHCIDESDKPILQYCFDGMFREAFSCPIGCSDDKLKCAECSENMTLCTGISEYKKCNNGSWGDEISNCQGDEVCTSQGCGKCNDGDKICFDNVLRNCNNGNWVVDSNCEYGCRGNESCADCDQNRCENDGVGRVILCINGVKNENPCDNVSCDLDKTGCGECLNGDTRCISKDEGDVLQTCVNGVWNEGIPCPNGCNEETGECKSSENTNCEPGVKKCKKAKGGEIGYLQPCKDGHWSNEVGDGEFCGKEGSYLSCKNQNECGVCLNGTKQCDGKKSQICIDGDWNDDETCPDKCDDGECVGETNQCTESQYRCKDNVYQVCHGGSWVEHTCSAGKCDDKGCMCIVESLYDGGNASDSVVLAETTCKTQDGSVTATCQNDGTWDNPDCTKDKVCTRDGDSNSSITCQICPSGIPCGDVCCSGECVSNKCKCKDGDDEIYDEGTGYCTNDEGKICGSNGDWKTTSCEPWKTCVENGDDQAVECKTLCVGGDVEYICRNGKVYKCSGSGSDGVEVTDENITGRFVSVGACVTDQTVCLNRIKYKKFTEQSNEPIIWIINGICGDDDSCSDSNKGEVCKDKDNGREPYKYCNGSGYETYIKSTSSTNDCIGMNQETNMIEIDKCGRCNENNETPECIIYNYYKDKSDSDRTINQCPPSS